MIYYCATYTTKEDLVYWKKKHGDGFGLPLITYWNSPLRLSIAHRQHNFGMLSLLLIVPPVEAQQRISNDAADNMFIESWYVNMAKQDLDKEQYADMESMLRSIHVPKHCYDSQKPPPTGRSIPKSMITENIDAIDSVEGDSKGIFSIGVEPCLKSSHW